MLEIAKLCNKRDGGEEQVPMAVDVCRERVSEGDEFLFGGMLRIETQLIPLSCDIKHFRFTSTM